MKQFIEDTLSTTNKRTGWTKIYRMRWVKRATPQTFTTVGELIGQLLDETQLQRAIDWRYAKIELRQHNDRMISATIKCQE